MASAKSPDEIRALLEGPVNSIPTTFNPDGSIDWPGVRNMIERGIQGGSGVSLLTYGDSRFDFLDDDEIAELTRVQVEQCRRRVLTVAATRNWWQGKAVDFARHCRQIGVDVLMSLPGQNMIPGSAGLTDYYRALAAELPLMLVGPVPMAIVQSLRNEPNVCCFKEDSTEDFAFELLRKHGDHYKLMTGGSLARHYRQWPFGCTAFMDLTACFKPEFGQRYWRAVRDNDTATVHRMVNIECELFDYSAGFTNSWHGLWRGMLEIHGVAKRGLRAPDRSCTDAEIEKLRAFLATRGLAP